MPHALTGKDALAFSKFRAKIDAMIPHITPGEPTEYVDMILSGFPVSREVKQALVEYVIDKI